MMVIDHLDDHRLPSLSLPLLSMSILGFSFQLWVRQCLRCLFHFHYPRLRNKSAKTARPAIGRGRGGLCDGHLSTCPVSRAPERTALLAIGNMLSRRPHGDDCRESRPWSTWSEAPAPPPARVVVARQSEGGVTWRGTFFIGPVVIRAMVWKPLAQPEKRLWPAPSGRHRPWQRTRSPCLAARVHGAPG